MHGFKLAVSTGIDVEVLQRESIRMIFTYTSPRGAGTTTLSGWWRGRPSPTCRAGSTSTPTRQRLARTGWSSRHLSTSSSSQTTTSTNRATWVLWLLIYTFDILQRSLLRLEQGIHVILMIILNPFQVPVPFPPFLPSFINNNTFIHSIII